VEGQVLGEKRRRGCPFFSKETTGKRPTGGSSNAAAESKRKDSSGYPGEFCPVQGRATSTARVEGKSFALSQNMFCQAPRCRKDQTLGCCDESYLGTAGYPGGGTIWGKKGISVTISSPWNEIH